MNSLTDYLLLFLFGCVIGSLLVRFGNRRR